MTHKYGLLITTSDKKSSEISYPYHKFSVTGLDLIVVRAYVSAVDSNSPFHIIWLQHILQYVTIVVLIEIKT